MKEMYIEDFEKWQQDFDFYVDIDVRFSETDLLGHLNNSVPFVYFEQARIDLMKHSALMKNFLSDQENISVVADQQCDYLGQIYFGETVRVYAKFAKVGSSSLDIHYMGKVNDDVRLTGRGAIVQISSSTGKAIKWTEEQLHYINKV